MTEEQLKAMEGSAPLLVTEYRKLQAELVFKAERLRIAHEDINVWMKSDTDAIRRLCRDMLYTLHSGITAYSTITELTDRAKSLSVKTP